MKRAFTLIELLVVIAILAMLLAVGLPVAKQVREQGAEAVCQSNLRQMVMILKTYTNDHDGLFPNPTYIYHSRESFRRYKRQDPLDVPYGAGYPWTCRWHDARIGLDSPLMREHKELQGDLIPYLGDAKILLCKTGVRAYLERGCNQDPNKPRRPQPGLWGGGRGRFRGRGSGNGDSDEGEPTDPLTLVPQYAYTMNGNLHRTLVTGSLAAGSAGEINVKTVRATAVSKETHVTRSPAEVFAFGEENSWPINRESRWPASHNLSGPWGGTPDGTMNAPIDAVVRGSLRFRVTGAITLGSLDIGPSYTTFDSSLDRPHASKMPETDVGDAFATYHRPRGGDLNTGHSFISMLDGHVRKVTVSDQLRRSRQDPNIPPSKLGPGGNLHLAWPLDVPPLAGWENQ
ncbi:MAG TPA: type II secretion system protein [Sedimentisphaerales bacterium]|nr:type II secretion system protein [Sedimentisphaerales bacterium]